MNSYAQLKQDVSVIEMYHEKKSGYFVDIGANDGINLSNTYLLEHMFDWSGICVEPLPYRYDQLITNRPKSKCYNCAVYSVDNLDVSFVCADLFSGISDCIDRHTQFKRYPKIIVKTRRLDNILKECDSPRWIDYLSIDTEGSELEILKSMDFNTYSCGVIHVEHNYIEPRRSEMRQLLESYGYHFTRENQWDDEYVHPLNK